MRSFAEALLCVGVLGVCILLATCTAKQYNAISEKSCISGFVWDSEKGYTGEKCYVGDKG